MSEAFLTITEAVKYTGKSRRTLLRLAHQLAKTAPDQVLREKTDKGDIGRIQQQALQPATATQPSVRHEPKLSATSLAVPAPPQFEEKYLAIAQQG